MIIHISCSFGIQHTSGFNNHGELHNKSDHSYRNTFLSNLTVNTGDIEYFDAFVSSHPIDYPFLQELIRTIEDEQGFKLCIPERDMIIGSERNEDITKLITKR